MVHLKFITASFLGIVFIFSTSVNVNASPRSPKKHSKHHNHLSPRPRIVHGESAKIEDFPYLVFIMGYYYENDLYYQCGGSILSSSHVITAAHCVDVWRELSKESGYSSSRILVRAGSANNKHGGSVHEVGDYSVHPKYDPGKSTTYDLALLKLKDPIVIDEVTTKAIDMFPSGKDSEPGSFARAAGWGLLSYYHGTLPDQMQSINLTVVERNQCNESWVNYGTKNHQDGYLLHEGEICASDETRSTCSGDSGGPLVIDGKLAGVLSVGHECSSSPLPNIFTEVAHYRKWIDKVREEFEKERSPDDELTRDYSLSCL